MDPKRGLVDVTISDKTLPKRLDVLKRQSELARRAFDRDMLLNLAFFLDHQYTEWNSETNQIAEIGYRSKDKERPPRPVINKIMHYVQQEHANVMQTKPSADVLPATAEPSDLSIASVAQAYLRFLEDPTQADFFGELRDASFWALIAGEGFLKWTYDSKLDRPDVESVSPLDIYPDPYARRFSACRYVIHSTFMDVNDIQNIYGVEVEPTKAENNQDAMLKEMGQTTQLEGATVNELWVKPGSPKHPSGALRVWTGNDMLLDEEFPYDHGQLPFTQLGSIPRPNTPHYTCAVKYLRAPQIELNTYHAQKLMSRKKMANAKWYIPPGLELEQDPDDSTGQILRVANSTPGMDANVAPQLIQGTSMDDNGDGAWIVEEMNNVVGLHEVSQAQVPGRVEAAKAIELLRESDAARLNEMEATISESITKGYWQWLMTSKQYRNDEVVVAAYSPEGYPEVKKFMTDDFNPGMRINVTMGTGLSRSKAARQEYAMLLWEQGIIKDPEVFADIVDVPVDMISPERAFDIKLARNENLQMADDIPLTANSWDAHEIHIREHNNFRKTSQYQTISPEAQTMFEHHVQDHHNQLKAALGREAEKMDAAQGGVPTEAGDEVAPTTVPQAEQEGMV